MRRRVTVWLAIFLIVAGYLVSPAIALWHLISATTTGDIAALQRGIDWTSVRAGLKQDINDGVIAAFGGSTAGSSTQLAANTLPPFGASFVSNIAAASIDRDVTPENVVNMARHMQFSPDNTSPLSHLAMFRFDGPTECTIAFRGDDPDDGVLKLHFSLVHGEWTLERAWVPQDMIDWMAQQT